MTIEEAIEAIGKEIALNEEYNWTDALTEALKIGCEALDKQIEVKPVKENGCSYCPMCGAKLTETLDYGGYIEYNWCNNCGQSIKWE